MYVFITYYYHKYDQEEWHTYCQQGTLLKALLLLLHQVKGQNVAFFMEG